MEPEKQSEFVGFPGLCESGWDIWFAEMYICVALWGVFYVTRDRLFAMGTLLTKEQFCAAGFQAMLAPETMLRLGNSGWPFTIVTAPAPADRGGIKSIENDRGKMMGMR